jgi:hypothetical protein
VNKQTANPAITLSTGLFALLSSLLRTPGTGAPSTKATNQISLGRRAAAKTFTRNNNKSIQPRNSRQATTQRIATKLGCVAYFKRALFSLPALVLASLAFTPAPALAAAPETPELTVETHVPSPPSPSTEAVLRGVLNPNAAGVVGTYQFFYKVSQTGACEGESHTPASPGISFGGQHEELPAETLSALKPNTEYAVCLLAETSPTEKTLSAPVTFKTAIPLETPVNTKVKAGSITATTVEVEGELNPGEQREAEPGTYEFLYKLSAISAAPTGECEESRAPEPAETASGAVKEAVGPLELEHLQPNAKYTFCLRVHNEAGEEATGAPVTFNTNPAPPTIVSQSASHHNNAGESLNPGEARLEGVVNPNNQLTECHFQYGEASVEEHEVSCEPEVLKGFGEQNVAAVVGGLQPGHTYHYQIIARNGKGETAPLVEETVIPEETPRTSPATAVEPNGTEATLNGTLNPLHEHEPQPGSYEFVYRQSATECRRTNPSTGQPENEKATPSTAANGHLGENVEAKLSELQPGATYTFCLLARDKAEEPAVGPPQTFTTPAVALEISGTSATEVTATAAKLNAQIDPGGAETTYHFEYIDRAGYEAALAEGAANPYAKGVSTPESPSIGADNSLHTATAAIQGLQPGMTYHYRLVATNPKSPPGGTDGPDQTFTTETTGGESALPDGRAYELVSPPQKDGAEVLGINGSGITPAVGDPTQASEDGTSVTYIASAPVGANPPGNALSTQMFSTRGAGGWSSLDIATPHKHSIEGVSLNGEEYRRFSPDLSHALLLQLPGVLEPPLAPEIQQEVYGESEIYLRNNATNTFRAVVTAEPLPEVNFEGATPDLSHVVFGAPAGLDPNYPSAGGLYEWAAGQTRLVSVLPERLPASGQTLLGSTFVYSSRLDRPATRHAISDDGTRVVWSDEEGLFTRNMATGETLQVDAKQGGGRVAGEGAFKVANSDGSRVFFTDGNALVTGAHQGNQFEVQYHEGDLYMFEPARPEGERLTDLTLGVSGRVDVLEANEAGTSIYVRTPGVLASAPNSEGESATPCTETEHGAGHNGEFVPSACNLYLLRESSAGGGSWSVTFVAGGAEAGPYEGNEGRAEEPLQRQAARVSPSGRYLAFMSRRSLTGYDNRDANSGEPDEEVYLYDAETNRMLCASCNPTGARPVGQYAIAHEHIPGIAMDPPGTWRGRWVAAAIPGWTEDGKSYSSGYQPRYLNDEGRLFFTSSDALVPRDVNGRADVYEYEPVGVGSCQPPSYGQGASVVFNKTLGGCIGLISAGTGNTDSVFFDASVSGNDVFFTTQDGLVSQDKDGTADMYDARVCTQAEPCPSSLALSPACTTTDSCRVAPSPQPGVFGAPASATFVGAGNAAATPPPKKTTRKKTVKCARGKKRSHGRCVKAKKKRPKAKKARNDRRPGR